MFLPFEPINLEQFAVKKLITKTERQNELIELIGGGFTEANNYASTLIDRSAA